MNDKSEDITALAKALCKVQSEGLFALTDKENPFFKSKYADLSSCWTVARGPLTENGLSVAQLMESTEDGDPIVVTMLMHVSGQWIKSSLVIKPDKAGPQALGSAITYGRRYAFCAIVGICPEDDDAEKGTDRKKKPPEKKSPAKKTEDPKPNAYKKYLDGCAEIKAKIIEMDGNDKVYREGLATYDLKKANDLKGVGALAKIGGPMCKALRDYIAERETEKEIADAG